MYLDFCDLVYIVLVVGIAQIQNILKPEVITKGLVLELKTSYLRIYLVYLPL